MFKGLLIAGLIVFVSIFSINSLGARASRLASDYADRYHIYLDSSPTGGLSNQTTSSNSSGSNTSTEPISDVTDNWSGYVSTGGNYSGISGSWVVPDVSSASSGLSADASWIGIGGVTSNDLIQVGTQNVVSDGQVQARVFYERLPGSSKTISTIQINPGDSIYASIKEVANDEWNIGIKDNTTGQSYSKTVWYDSSESSAEWIEEAPSDSSGVIPLDSFGSISFSDGSTIENGQSTSIASSGAEAINIDNSQDEALTDTSALNSQGNGFSVTRTDASSVASVLPPNLDGFSVGRDRHEPGLGHNRGFSVSVGF